MFNLILKQLREDAGYSQYSFADAFGTKQSTVGGWESGAREPKIETLIKIANFYNVSLDYLLGRENKKETPSPVPVLGKDAQKLLDMYGELSVENKDQVMRYVTSIYYVDRANKSAQYSGALAAYEGGTEQHTVSKETAEKVLRRLDDMEKNT